MQKHNASIESQFTILAHPKSNQNMILKYNNLLCQNFVNISSFCFNKNTLKRIQDSLDENTTKCHTYNNATHGTGTMQISTTMSPIDSILGNSQIYL